ncbi:unnamed protein product [Phytophthora fragariaefolia]|uniref:Unnamed protein product n=1 Tax=Phytophthora fragariaefolia TaxID=1490495 RepID=A0A9W7D4Y7_9STRA|nr:unnamed protein product [Phytophthora fragariaefolia]
MSRLQNKTPYEKEEYKAYRLLDVYNNKFIYSRHVMFDTEHSVEIVSRAFGQEMTEETETSRSTSAVGDTIPPSISGPSTTNTTRNKKRGLVETVGALDNKPKRPRRETKRPARFDDYKCYQPHLDKISQEETNHNKISIPRNLKEALSGPYRKHWRKALDLEYESLINNVTWRLVPLPPGRKAFPCHWVLVVKYHANGFVERFKVRLVAQGNHQEFGVDCDEVYAPVARFESLRLVLAIGTILDCHIHQVDVHTAFLNGMMEGSQRIYMRQPPGYHAKGKEGYVCELLKRIYGLKQAPRIWYGVLHKFLKSMGFARCNKEYCIYVQKVGVDWIIIVVYVDDLTIMSKSLKLINNIKRELSMRCKMKDL